MTNQLPEEGVIRQAVKERGLFDNLVDRVLDGGRVGARERVQVQSFGYNKLVRVPGIMVRDTHR